MSMITMKMVDARTVYFHGNTYSYRDMIKAVPGSTWAKKDTRWEIPIDSVPDAVRIMPGLIMDDEVKTNFGRLKEQHTAAVAVKQDATKALTNIKGLKGTLRSYQGQGVTFAQMVQTGQGVILAFDMGTGKSLSALAAFVHMKAQGIVDHLLVVCPSPLKYATWMEEVEKWTDLEAVVIDGDKRETVEWDDGTQEKITGRDLRAVQYQQYLFGTDVTIMNYELFLQDVESEKYEKVRPLTSEEVAYLDKLATQIGQQKGLVKTNKKVKQKAIALFLADTLKNPRGYTVRGNKTPEICKVHPIPRIIPEMTGRWMVVLDEAHRIKNPNAQVTKNMLDILKPAGRKILATGTPLENNIQELWSLVDLCRPGILGDYYKFLNRYVELDFYNNPIAPKPQMLGELREKLEPIMFRVTKKEALPELPELTMMDYRVDMTAAQEKLYKAVKEGVLQNAKTEEFSYLEVIVQITRMQQVLDSPALLRELLEDDTLPIESGKLPALKSIISDINPQRNKFILFSQYSEMTDILYKWLQEENILPKEQIGYVKGGIKASETLRVKKGFQEGNIQCVLMTTAGNYGLNLFAGSYVICYDQLFNPQKMEQIYSRAHRSGNTTGVTAINLVTNNSYEERKLQVLEKKREVFKAMVDADDEMFAKMFTKQELLDLL